jgi:predicted choloylglycine hydrolase
MAVTIPFTFHAFAEPAPGPRWRALFDAAWPVYQRWYLKEGDAARPSYVTARRMLRTHMPELLETYDRLVDLAGGGDVAARMLTLYRPPPYLAGCSQAALAAPSPVLVRNYDYAPSRLEGVVQSTAWGKHRVIGMSDCLWGLLDGMNDAGLAVSLTFGGRRVLGDGFGIPVIVRYLLETCGSVAEAREALHRVPVNLAHNLTLVDLHGEAATVALAPDRAPGWNSCPVATNHQGAVEWEEHARFTRTVERERHLAALIAAPDLTPDRLADAFQEPPLFSTEYSRGFGTLYTAVYRPAEGAVTYHWPGATWTQSFAEFRDGMFTASFREPAAA